MKTIFLLLLFSTISLTAFCQTTNDSTAIVNLLRNDYTALGNLDSKKHIENCTEDYILIENGEIWNLKKEVQILFKPQSNSKTVRYDTFDFKRVKIDKPYAYAVYELKSQITINGNTKKYHWTESAIFYKAKGAWKIKLIHSTEVND